VASQLYNVTKNLVPQLQPPNVNLTCLGSTGQFFFIFSWKILTDSKGIPTEKHFQWKSISATSAEYPETLCGDGDGTLAVESLRVCQFWQQNEMNEKPIYYNEWVGASHVGILSDERLLNEVVSLCGAMSLIQQ
jgi:hypothetical protein